MSSGIIPPKGVLKVCSGSQATDGSGIATIEIKVPGTFVNTSTPGRLIAGGRAWFENPAHGDCVCKLEIVDVDNILGAGAGYVVTRYIDDGVDSANQLVEICKQHGFAEVDSFEDPGAPPSELYLRIEGKAAANRSDTFRVNVLWAEPT